MSDTSWLPELRARVHPLVLETGAFIRSNFGQVRASDADVKSLNSLVSRVDIEAERKIVEALSAMSPSAGFLTEEDTRDTRSDSELTWIIDPLDGTTNFLHGIPVFAISIALKQEETIVFGVVYDVMRDIYYEAIRGGGAFMNGVPISCSATKVWSESVIATGFPYQTYELGHPMYDVLGHVIRTARGLRRLGSAAIDLACVASGVFDVYYEARLNPWDFAAGILLVEEAGGRTTDFFKGHSSLSNGTVIASNSYLHGSIQEIISDAGLTPEMLS